MHSGQFIKAISQFTPHTNNSKIIPHNLIIYKSAVSKIEEELDLSFSKLNLGDKKALLDLGFEETFPKTAKSITAFTTAMKGAEGATGKFKAAFTGLGAAMKANPVGAVIAAITTLVAIIGIAENAYDESHDNLDDLSEKGKEISDRLSETRSEIENVDEQIAELEQRKLNITDLSDIDNLNTQIELLKQRKELLDAKASNEKEEAKNNAEKKIEGTKTNSVYSGAKYADGYSGKFSKWDDFWNYAAGDAQLATYSAEEYVNTLENRLSSIHPGELESVIDNLNEIYETYDEIAQNNELVGTEAYETAIKKQEQIII